MDSDAWIGLGTLATAIVGLSFVGWQVREQRRMMRVELGNLYVQRYWEIDDDLLLERKGSSRHNQHRHRYMRLFEDEFDVAALGFLDKQQWRVWHSVLDDVTALGRVQDDLHACDPAEDQFRRLRACIGQRVREGVTHDVAECEGA